MINVINYLTFIVSTIFTYIMGILSKKHKWNEELPIPLQNAVIGLIVFVLAYVFCLFMKVNVTQQDLLNYVLLSLGGSGTATLGYDIQKIGEKK